MRNLSNSLQFRLYATFALLILLILAFAAVTAHAAERSALVSDQSIAAAAQRTSAYVLITLMRRYIDAGQDSTRENIKAFAIETQKSLQQNEKALRYGDADLQIVALSNPNLLSLLDSMDAAEVQFDQTVSNLLAADPSDWGNLILKVGDTGTAFATYAESLVTGIGDLADQDEVAENTLRNVITGMMFVALGIAAWMIVLTVRAINRLASTAQAFAEGDLQARATVNTMSELAQVGQTFNEMAEHLQEVIDDLQRQVEVAEQAQARAERSDQVKSAFLASVSHELRTPLNAIINFSKFVLRGVMGPINERQTEALTRVVQSGVHLLNLINDVLDISKIESGSLNLFIEDNVNVVQVVRESCKTAEGLLEEKSVTLETDIASDIPLMSIDEKRFRQIMNNILSNACKFTEAGSIKVSARCNDGQLEVSIADTGQGIAVEDAHLVFEPFRQTETGLRQGMGTGLGMPISRSLAEAMDGRLWFESAVGKGSTFFLTLPINVQESATILA